MVWHGLANISDVSESDIEACKIREGQYPDIIQFCSISKGFFFALDRTLPPDMFGLYLDAGALKS